MISLTSDSRRSAASRTATASLVSGDALDTMTSHLPAQERKSPHVVDLDPHVPDIPVLSAKLAREAQVRAMELARELSGVVPALGRPDLNDRRHVCLLRDGCGGGI